MAVVNPSFGNGAFAAIENLRVQTPGKAGATSTEFRNLHEPLMTLKVRVPFEGLRSNLVNRIFVVGGRVVVVNHAPASRMVVAEKYVLEIELSRPLLIVIE
jgi:hypothetical protein